MSRRTNPLFDHDDDRLGIYTRGEHEFRPWLRLRAGGAKFPGAFRAVPNVCAVITPGQAKRFPSIGCNWTRAANPASALTMRIRTHFHHPLHH